VASQRSTEWYGETGRNGYAHRAWMRRGLPAHAFDGRPHIMLANTASDLTPCNAHLNEVAEAVARGVWEAGGVPMNVPVTSLGETLVRPTAMLWRNMAAMTIEEMLRANPVDGAVLLGGCDKTIPAMLMAASSVDLPALVVPGGPMLTGTFRGKPLGCGTDVWKLSEQVRAGLLTEQDFTASESSMIRSRGHCNTMGTASTMACMAEALGMTIPGVAGIPAPDSRLLESAHAAGRLAVEMVAAGRRPSTVLSAGSFRNAIVALAAIGGSTNAVVHLLAIAGRAGVPLTLDDFDEIGSGVPLLADMQPAGRHLMEDFHRAGGLLAVLREVADLLDPDALTVTGQPLAAQLDGARIWDSEVLRTRAEPLQDAAGIAVLRGSLAPDGAVIKPAAASPHLLQHRGRAVVFDSIEDFRHRIDDPALDVDADSVLVLRGCGPRG
jgi:dihydroxyacid dehydratase/phosphogluconate dehydratase